MDRVMMTLWMSHKETNKEPQAGAKIKRLMQHRPYKKINLEGFSK